MFISVDAHVRGNPIHTKRALRHALADDPEKVVFTRLGMFEHGSLHASDIQHGMYLSVVLLCSFTDGRSFAIVTKNRDGTIRVR